MLSAASVGNALLEQNSVAIYSLLSFCSARYWTVRPVADTARHFAYITEGRRSSAPRTSKITQYPCVTEQSSWLSRCDMSLLRTFHVNTHYYALKAGGSFDKDAIPLAVLTEEERTKKMA